MAKDYVAFIIDAEPTLSEFTALLTEFNNVIERLSQEVFPHKKLVWTLGGLSYGSAHTLAKGIYETEEEKDAVFKAVERYEQYGDDLSRGRLSGYSGPLQESGATIIEFSRYLPIRFETEEKDSVIHAMDAPKALDVSQTAPQMAPLPGTSFGAVRGRVESLTRRNELRFTLYDCIYDKAVSCYLASGQEDLMRQVWGRLAMVEGVIKREAGTGRPLTIRHIKRVELIEEEPKYTWKDVVGCFPAGEGRADLGEIIEQLRNE